MEWVGEANTVADGEPTGTGDDLSLVGELLPDSLSEDKKKSTLKGQAFATRMTYPSGTRTVLVLDNSEVSHEFLDLGVLVGIEVESAFCLAVAEARDVGVLYVVAHSVTDRPDPLDLAAKHLGELVRLGRELRQRCNIRERASDDSQKESGRWACQPQHGRGGSESCPSS